MRSYASDTALPGGKYEEGDVDEEAIAVSSASNLVTEASLTPSRDGNPSKR
jgi:hypothetical protein